VHGIKSIKYNYIKEGSIMKKIIPVVILSLLLTACDSKVTSSGTSVSEDISSGDSLGTDDTPIGGNVKTVADNYDADFEICQNTSYVNLDWTNTGKCPVDPASELFNITCQNQMANEVMSQKEMLMKFEEYCRFYFGEYIDDCACFDPEYDKGEEILPHPEPIEINGVSYRSHYKISDYKEKLESETVLLNDLVYRNIEKNQYLW